MNGACATRTLAWPTYVLVNKNVLMIQIEIRRRQVAQIIQENPDADIRELTAQIRREANDRRFVEPLQDPQVVVGEAQTPIEDFIGIVRAEMTAWPGIEDA